MYVLLSFAVSVSVSILLLLEYKNVEEKGEEENKNHHPQSTIYSNTEYRIPNTAKSQHRHPSLACYPPKES